MFKILLLHLGFLPAIILASDDYQYAEILSDTRVKTSEFEAILFKGEIVEILDSKSRKDGLFADFAGDSIFVYYTSYNKLDANKYNVANYDSIRLHFIKRVNRGGLPHYDVNVGGLKRQGKDIFLASLKTKDVVRFDKQIQAFIEPKKLGRIFRLIVPGAKTLFYRRDEIEDAAPQITRLTHDVYITRNKNRIVIDKDSQEAFWWLEDDIQPIDEGEYETSDGSTLVIQHGRRTSVIAPKAFYEEWWLLIGTGIITLVLIIGLVAIPAWERRQSRRKLKTQGRLEHKIKKGDTLKKLSQRYGIATQDIMIVNDRLIGRVGSDDKLSEKLGRTHINIQKGTKPEDLEKKQEDRAEKGWPPDEESVERARDSSVWLRDIAHSIKKIESRLDEGQEMELREKLEKVRQEKAALEHTNADLLTTNKNLESLLFPFEDAKSLAKVHLDFINGLLKTEGKAEELQAKSVQMESGEAKLITSFLGYFYRRKNQAQVARWQSILTKLIRDGVVTDSELIRRLKPDTKVELQHKTFNLRVYEEVYKLYLSALMILLEELRSLGRFVGQQSVIAQDAATLENDIRAIQNHAAKNLNIQINHVHLFTDYTQGPTNVIDETPSPVYEEYRDKLKLNKKDILEIKSVGLGEEKTTVILAR